MARDAVIAFRRATVMVGQIETSYQRAGVGRPLVLLVPPPQDLSVLEPLLHRWRVVVPESTSVLALPGAPGSTPFAGWLRGFLEGLGLQRACIVADTSVAVALATVRAQQPELIEHVEIVGRPPHAWAEVAASVAAVLAD